MKKIRLSLLFVVFIAVLFSCQTTNSGQSTETVETLANGITTQLLEKIDYNSMKNIAVLPFVESGSNKNNEFSLYFADELVTSLFKVNQQDLVIYERSQVNQLMKEAEFAATGLISLTRIKPERTNVNCITSTQPYARSKSLSVPDTHSCIYP